jgi:hypothetical protein
MSPLRGDHAALLVVIKVSSYLHNSMSSHAGGGEGRVGLISETFDYVQRILSNRLKSQVPRNNN